MDASRIWKPLMAEWWTQQPEPKWSPKDTGREERHSSCVNGYPVSEIWTRNGAAQSHNGVPREDNKMQMEGKKTVLFSFLFFTDALMDGHPLRPKWIPPLLPSQHLISSINKLQLHLLMCVCVVVSRIVMLGVSVWPITARESPQFAIVVFCKDLQSLKRKVRKWQCVNIHVV